jgi:hypothetical protein
MHSEVPKSSRATHRGAKRATPVLPGAFWVLAALCSIAVSNGTAVGARLIAPLLPGTHPQGSCLGGSLVSSPNPGSGDNRVLDVAATGPNDGWAVGFYYDGSGFARTLTMHWDGAQWTTVGSPNAGSGSSYLYDVAAISANDVWAVGNYTGGARPTSTLTMHWDGTQWTIVSSPNAGSLANDLRGVTATGPNDVWAVGFYFGNDNHDKTLAMHWNGTQWTIFTTPDPGPAINRLFGAAAVAPNDVWAVGNYNIPASDLFLTLTLHWNGTQWSVVSSPNPGAEYNLVIEVSATSASDAWAVGFWTAGDSTGNHQTLTIHWDGTQWSVVSSPNSDYNTNYLYGVSGTSANDVWAVGFGQNSVGQNPGQTLAIHWDGTHWTRAASPSPGTTFNILEGVAAVAPRGALAAGSYRNSGTTSQRTLAINFTGECTSPTATTTPPTSTRTPSGTPTGAPTNTPTAVPTGTPSPTAPQATATRTSTPSGTPAATQAPTHTPTSTPTPTAPRATGTPCVVSFSDVHSADYFYQPVAYLWCRGVISGYNDNTFRPYADTTRAQLAKIVVLVQEWAVQTPSTPTFSDVPASHPFYAYIETAYARGIVSGYSDDTFHPYANVTRGQLSKIVVLARAWSISTPTSPTFSDVPASHPFYAYIETAYAHNIISGYMCSGTGCLEFRSANNATRGQISKIVCNAATQP